jgi:hypothetical protein
LRLLLLLLLQLLQQQLNRHIAEVEGLLADAAHVVWLVNSMLLQKVLHQTVLYTTELDSQPEDVLLLWHGS